MSGAAFTPRQCAAGRELAGVSPQALANKAGVALADLVAYEAGEAVPADVQRRICAALAKRLHLKPIAETALAGDGLRFTKPAAKRLAARRRTS